MYVMHVCMYVCAICQGLLDQISSDKSGLFMLGGFDDLLSQRSHVMDEVHAMLEQCDAVEEEDEWEVEDAYDDVSFGPLDPKLVYKAMQ